MVSLRNNPIARSTLLFDIIDAIKENKKPDKRAIGKSFNSKGLDWNKRELDYVIAWALENNYLAETSNHELRLGETKPKSPKQDFKLVLTIPPYTELGLKNIAHRNQMMTTHPLLLLSQFVFLINLVWQLYQDIFFYLSCHTNLLYLCPI